ncbi:hypothetical protein DSLASN_10950 [Desulfoluna limicola]|uniref:Uncharacterized protein n=1 Tax=Desulfoluna limicola TaxID=2810562 RepID=A0ABN6F0K7_9BACT|nr:hypothetical protein [Desulfoluna limicola]BCS95463.1 hypothetical protein DSLASN_10950 [Desulfoluna limicola]
MVIRHIIPIIIASIFLVLFTYVKQFGFSLSPSHSRWAEFGSFFGGVIGSILAFSTLLYLALQIKQQTKEYRDSRIESEIKQREDSILMYLTMLHAKLFEKDSMLGYPLSELILDIHDNEIKYEESTIIKIGLSARAEALVMWTNISGYLSFIKARNENRYQNQLILVSVKIGYDVCVALDTTVKKATGLNFEQHFFLQ